MDKPLQDEIVLKGGLKLYKAADYNREWNVTVTATVAALPKKIYGKSKANIANLQLGDEVCFSYQVCNDVSFGTTGNYFMPEIEENPHILRWSNAEGKKINVTNLLPVHGFSRIWVGLLVDEYNERIDGTQGTEREVKKWLSQFTFSGVQDYKFNNLLDINGKILWKCDLDQIFAKRVKNKLVAIGDRVICEPIETDIKTMMQITAGIDIPFQDVKMRYYDRAKVVSGGEDIGIKKGDIISFESKYVEKYTLFGKDYFIIKKRRVNGKWL